MFGAKLSGGICVAVLALSSASAVAQVKAPVAKPKPVAVSTVGVWKGGITLGPSQFSRELTATEQKQLVYSKLFMRSVKMQLTLLKDKKFVLHTSGYDSLTRKSVGTWTEEEGMVTLLMKAENGVPSKRILIAMLAPDKQQFVIKVKSKKGLPDSKLVFRRVPDQLLNPVAAKKATAAQGFAKTP